MSYASLADLKQAIHATTNADDDLLQAALDAADHAIDAHCDRTFVADSVVSAREFEVPGGNHAVRVDDIWTTTGLVVSSGGTVVPLAVPGVSNGYWTEPLNAPSERHGPITHIWYYNNLNEWPIVAGISGYGWPHTLSVVAKWGYSENVPAVVSMAALLQASRFYSRKNSPYGVAGSPDLGNEMRLLAKVDPDVAVLLAGLVRY